MIRSDGYPNLTVDTRSRVILHLDLVSTLLIELAVIPRGSSGEHVFTPLPGRLMINLTPRAERFSLTIFIIKIAHSVCLL